MAHNSLAALETCSSESWDVSACPSSPLCSITHIPPCQGQNGASSVFREKLYLKPPAPKKRITFSRLQGEMCAPISKLSKASLPPHSLQRSLCTLRHWSVLRDLWALKPQLLSREVTPFMMRRHQFYSLSQVPGEPHGPISPHPALQPTPPSPLMSYSHKYLLKQRSPG